MSFISHLSSLLGSRLPIAPMPVAPATPSAQTLEAFTATAELVPTKGEAVVQTPTGRQPTLWSRFVAAVMGVKATITSFFVRTPEHPVPHGLREMTVEQIQPPVVHARLTAAPQAAVLPTPTPTPVRPSEEHIGECVAVAVRAAFAGSDDHDRVVANAIRQASAMASRTARQAHPAAFASGQLPQDAVWQAVAEATAQVRNLMYIPSAQELSRQAALMRPVRSGPELGKLFDAEVQRALPPGHALDAAAFERHKQQAIAGVTTLLWNSQARGEHVAKAALDAVQAYQRAAVPVRTQARPDFEVSSGTPSRAEQEAQFEQLYERAQELEAQLKARDAAAPSAE